MKCLRAVRSLNVFFLFLFVSVRAQLYYKQHLPDNIFLGFISLRVVETRGTRRERASKANKDRWCMQQRYRGEEAGGGGGGNGELSVEEKDTVEEMLSSREGRGRRGKSSMKEDISNLPSCEQRGCAASCSLFLCPSISIAYLIDKARGVLKSWARARSQPAEPERSTESLIWGIISYYGHASLCTHPTRTGTAGAHAHSKLINTYINTAALHTLYLSSHCGFGLAWLKSLSHTSDALSDRPYRWVKDAKCCRVSSLLSYFHLTGGAVCDVQEV